MGFEGQKKAMKIGQSSEREANSFSLAVCAKAVLEVGLIHHFILLFSYSSFTPCPLPSCPL